MEDARPFAMHGSEKMLYDIRMSPQCIHRDGTFWVSYQANPDGGKPLPHVISRDADGTWSKPVVVGDVAGYDQHFAPIIWPGADEHIHLLYHCHAARDGSRHLVSAEPCDITRWNEASLVAPSVSYPRILPCLDDKLVLYNRVKGHLGFWTFLLSGDGGHSWTPAEQPHVDFDHLPEDEVDEWAGSYHSVALSTDGRSLHVAFVYWDERKLPCPRYGVKVGHSTRFNLYYLRLDLMSGSIFTIEGKPLEMPLNRRGAEACLVWDTDGCLTNMPSILVDADDAPSFLLPASEEAVDRCRFWYIRRQGNEWARTPVTRTRNTWNASHMEFGDDGNITVFLIGDTDGIGDCPYGGGPLQEWRSTDRGETWRQVGDHTPEPGLLCSNPKPIVNFDGSIMKRSLIFFGWEGPDSISPRGPYKGRAYLWQDGAWL